MALDAAVLSLTAAELKQELCGLRIDKIYQPARDEAVFLLRGPGISCKLLLSARSGSARVCVTQEAYENPAVPPSFCMLLRKHLSGGKLEDVRTVPGERIVFFDFTCTNEMGDRVVCALAAELMGRYCNLVLIARGPAEGAPYDVGAGKILDALRRVDFEDSDIRQLLPGLAYTLPPQPDKIGFFETQPVDLWAAIEKEDRPIAQLLGRKMWGIGPVVAREIEWRVLQGQDIFAGNLNAAQQKKIQNTFAEVQQAYLQGGKPTAVIDAQGDGIEYSFLPLTQYLPGAELKEYESFSLMLQDFYAAKDKKERLRQRSKQMHKTLHTMYDRAVRRQAAREEDLAKSEQSETWREYGELLLANLHTFKKGDPSVVITDWNTQQPKKIKLDVALTPIENAQKYFKEYKKRQTAVKKLKELLVQGQQEVEYLATVLYELDAASDEVQLADIRAELQSQGRMRPTKTKEKRSAPADFLRYISSDGFLILVGRNNAQNDRLTIKTARGKDMWFHIKNAPGSHVVVMSEGKDIPLPTQNEAAMLAVWHSSQKKSAKVPVDYTQVKNIRKTGDLPPGMVLYDHYETGYLTVSEEDIFAIKKEKE